MDNIRIAILEDNRIMREGILALMKPENDFSLIAADLKTDSVQILNDFNPQNWSLNNPAKYTQNQDELDKDNPLR